MLRYCGWHLMLLWIGRYLGWLSIACHSAVETLQANRHVQKEKKNGMRKLVQMPFFNNLSVLVDFERAVSLWSENLVMVWCYWPRHKNTKFLQKQNPPSKTVVVLWSILLLNSLFWSVSDKRLVGKLDFCEKTIKYSWFLMRWGYWERVFWHNIHESLKIILLIWLPKTLTFTMCLLFFHRDYLPFRTLIQPHLPLGLGISDVKDDRSSLLVFV